MKPPLSTAASTPSTVGLRHFEANLLNFKKETHMEFPDLNASAIMKRMTRLTLLSQRAVKVANQMQSKSLAKASGSEYSLMDAQTLARAYGKVWAEFLTKPAELIETQVALAKTMSGLWSAMLPGASDKGSPATDRRFRDKSWDEDVTAKLYRDVYKVFEASVGTVLDRLDADQKEDLRVKFYTRQLLSSLSPSNYLATNAAARDKFLETGGDSLLDGLENLMEDLERGEGRLDIATNDTSAFKVGADLGTTEGEVVFQNELMQLIHYHPRTKEQFKEPFLFVPAWINKFYILDMRPENSLVRFMLDQGHSVFVISWVNPTKSHADLDFADYMRLGPLAAMDVMCDITKHEKLNILGFCIGGILVTATLAYLAAIGDTRINTATTLATMIDFTDVGEIGVFIDDDRLEILRGHMEEKGYLEAHHLQDMFSMLRENDLIWSFFEANYLRGDKPRAFDLLFWNSDATRLPSAMLLWYLSEVYLKNQLRKPGGLDMNGVKIDVSTVTVPTFVLATVDDHIAPWRSVYPTTGLLGGEVEFVLGGSGHIAGVINPPSKSRQKYGFKTAPHYPETPDGFLQTASDHAGSWWPYWSEWVERHCSGTVAARKPGTLKKYGSIEPAPGTYVLPQ